MCTLRKLLSECSAGLQNYILLEEGYYRLCPSVRVETDVEEFDLRYERGRRVEKTNRMEGASEYERAVELYRGEYLLEHLYEDWTMVERQRLSNAYLDMLERLAEYYKQTEQLRESIRICYRILQKDRSHENSHLLLTECFALLGSYGRALHQYEMFRRCLKSTYATEPSVETRRRFEKVLSRL
jgi:two-component SAPR family response regulator